MRAAAAAIALAVSAWSQEPKPGPPQEEIRQIQAFLEFDKGAPEEAFAAFKARHDAQFERLEALVSASLIAQIEATPDMQGPDLRNRLIDLLGIKADPNDPYQPFVQRTLAQRTLVQQAGPSAGQTSPIVFSIVYDGHAWDGTGGARTVIESYVLDRGKARLAGRLGRELDGIGGGVAQVTGDELLLYGLLEWSSGANLPYKAALYRVNQSGVSLAWSSEALPGLEARVFGKNLVLHYRDDKAAGQDKGFVWALDVYALDTGVPKLVFHGDF